MAHRPYDPPPAPLEIPNGYGEARLRILLANSDEALVTFGYDNAGAVNPNTVAEDIATAVQGTNDILGLLTPAMTFDRVSVLQRRATVLEVGEFFVSAAGVSSEPASAPAVSVCIQKRTAIAGRSQRGRFFLPQPAEGDVEESGLLTPTLRTAYQDWADESLANLITAGYQMVLLHREVLVKPRTTPDTYTAAGAPTTVAQLVVNQKVATQKRRNNP